MREIRLCRFDDSAKGGRGAHYWSPRTGQPVGDPREPGFTPEELCPRHRRAPERRRR